MASTTEQTGIIFEADVYLRKFENNVLSKDVIGILETTVFTAKPSSEIITRSAFRIGLTGKTRGSVGQPSATAIKLSFNAVDADILGLLMLSTNSALTVAGGVVAAESFHSKHDRWVKLDESNITTGTPSIVGATLDTDYNIEEKLGLVRVLSTGSLADDVDLDIAYSFGAKSGITINAGTKSKIEVSLEGRTRSREDGSEGFVRIPKVSLTLSNDLTLVGGDYATAEFDGECVLIDGEDADFYLDSEIVYS
jgi:hypothetical protein